MQFLTLLMREVPERVRAEREALERLFREAMEKLSQCVEKADAYRSTLDQRLVALPAQVAEGLRPEMIAREINESLRQQFIQSTVPQTARQMTAVAAQLQAAVAEFGKTAAMLNDSHHGAAQNARQAIERLEHAVSQAARGALQAAEALSSAIRSEQRWSIYTLVSLILIFGLGTGMMFQRWLDSPPKVALQPQPVLEKAPAKIKRPPSR